jgi:hypothetical protein
MSISLEMLEEMFENMRTKSGWNTDDALLWGYFFTDRDPKKLGPVADHLAADGYRLVKIYPTDDGATTFLHVERIERHTPYSLHERNAMFYALAARFGIDSYDGMDVGPAPKQH